MSSETRVTRRGGRQPVVAEIELAVMHDRLSRVPRRTAEYRDMRRRYAILYNVSDRAIDLMMARYAARMAPENKAAEPPQASAATTEHGAQPDIAHCSAPGTGSATPTSGETANG